MKRGYSQRTVNENKLALTNSGVPYRTAIAESLDFARLCYWAEHPQGFLPKHLAFPGGSRERANAPEKFRKNPTKRPGNPAKFERSEEITRQLKSAMELYKNFSGHSPELVGRLEKPEIPDVGIIIGELDGIAYETVRDGITEKYFHRFDKKVRPLLASSFDGRLIYILGGEYDFTEDGIVDATDKRYSPRQKR